MGERLAGGNVALALLANTLATGAALVALILTFGPISGAHLKPAVTLAESTRDALPWRQAGPYIAVQIAGAVTGVALADSMFDEPMFSLSGHDVPGFVVAQLLGAGAATALFRWLLPPLPDVALRAEEVHRLAG